MYRIGKLFIIILLGLFFMGCATQQHYRYYSQSSLGKLERQLTSLFNDTAFENAIWGVEIRSAKNDQVIYQRNANKNLMPASNMKMYTTAAGLHYLGPDYRYTTKFWGNSNISTDGVMEGDLIIQGSGDPSISGRYSRGSTTSEKIVLEWVDQIKSKGIKEIRGNIIGDDDVFDDIYLIYSWMWGYTPSAFSAQQSGLCFNDNSYDLYFLPGENIGEPAKYWLGVPTNYLTIISEVTTCDTTENTSIDVGRDWNTNNIYVTGRIALNEDTTREWGSVHNPTLYLATILHEYLNQNGITVTGEPKDIDDYSEEAKKELYIRNPEILFTFQSPPLSRILQMINKPSQNLYTEQLLKTIGKEVKGVGSTRKGVEAVKEFLGSFGVNLNQFEMVDGCGLSRSDIVQPHQSVQLLKYMYHHPHFQTYYDSFPIAGVDGTISSRMRRTAAEGNVHAKTGYIGYVRCLSGYVKTRDGETLIFSFMVNHYTVSTREANELQDKACILLANFSRHKK